VTDERDAGVAGDDGAGASEPRPARAARPAGFGPRAVELFMDYHCPYSHRATAWLDGLPADLVTVSHRLFALEQVNRDPTATAWRLWEQPLDYVHYRERQDRRPLAAFLATAILEATEPPEVVTRFRLGVYAARFEQGGDIADLDVLDGVALAAGVARGRLGEGLADPTQAAAARQRIADDWAGSRAEYATFGVPTLRIDGGVPFYLRLAGPVDPASGAAFLTAILDFRAAAPGVLELKVPERVAESGGA
jgi:hypothetical protein